MIDCSGQARVRQLQSVGKMRDQANATFFFNALTDEGMFEMLESLLPEYRERVYTPTDTLSMFLSQALNADWSSPDFIDTGFESVNQICTFSTYLRRGSVPECRV